VREDVAKHVKELKEMAGMYTHAAQVYDAFSAACNRLASLLEHAASMEEKFDKIIWRVEEHG